MGNKWLLPLHLSVLSDSILIIGSTVWGLFMLIQSAAVVFMEACSCGLSGDAEKSLCYWQNSAFRSRGCFSALDLLAPAAHLKSRQGSSNDIGIMGTKQEIQRLSPFHLNYQATHLDHDSGHTATQVLIYKYKKLLKCEDTGCFIYKRTHIRQNPS